MLRIDLGNYEKLGTAAGFSIVPLASVRHFMIVPKRHNPFATSASGSAVGFQQERVGKRASRRR